MGKGFFKVPVATNEPVNSYIKGSKAREEVLSMYKEMYHSQVEVPLYIGKEEIKTGDTGTMHPPHDHQHTLGTYHKATKAHIQLAIEGALEARKEWSQMPWEHRAGIFLRAAELISGPYRAKINAATMLGQSKNIHQAEIDAVCELIDFLRYNVQYMTEIYHEQPESTTAEWNRVEYRPLEGFVYAITPFNFTAIAGNLPASAAMMGNVVVWKPSSTQMYSAQVLMEVFKEAGLPAGVINMVAGSASMITEVVLASPDFSGVHFTGSTGVFNSLWTTIGQNINNYKTYPRIVGETGGKDFIVAHGSSNPKQVAAAISRGAFEFQGQKCSAASRAYIAKSIWSEVKEILVNDIQGFKMGTPDNTENFITAVIDEKSFDNLASYIDQAKKDKGVEIIAGGNYDKSKGYFIDPTVILTDNPKYTTMCTELFGPVITIYVFEDSKWEETLKLVDTTSEYALTGAVFSTERYALDIAVRTLENASGNFYINDKPTGAVVGKQPFGGARKSGTNDKAGSKQNLYRWLSTRLIKETFVATETYRYPYLD